MAAGPAGCWLWSTRPSASQFSWEPAVEHLPLPTHCLPTRSYALLTNLQKPHSNHSKITNQSYGYVIYQKGKWLSQTSITETPGKADVVVQMAHNIEVTNSCDSFTEEVSARRNQFAHCFSHTQSRRPASGCQSKGFVV